MKITIARQMLINENIKKVNQKCFFNNCLNINYVLATFRLRRSSNFVSGSYIIRPIAGKTDIGIVFWNIPLPSFTQRYYHSRPTIAPFIAVYKVTA